MPKGRTRSTTTTSGTQSQNTVGTGTPFAQGVLDQMGQQNVLGQVFAANDGGYQGPREAGINIPTNVGGTYGAIPTTFVPQRTTTDAPNQTYVDVNYQPGIQAGLDNANNQAGALSNLSASGLASVGQQINSPHLGLDQMLAALQNQHNIASNQSTQAQAEVMGEQGGFGGSAFLRGNAMQQGELQRAFDEQAAQLLWQDQARRDDWLRNGAGVAGQWAGLGDLTPQRLLNYGGLDLQNQQQAADVANFNAWNQGSLVDQNADRAAQEAIAQWEQAFNVSQQNAQNDMTRAALEQANAQTGLNNDYYQWAGGQESLDQMLNRLAGLMNTAATAPGGSSSGTMNQTSTTTQQQSSNPLAAFGSLLGAGMQFMGGGGFGSLTGAQGGASMLPQVPSLAQLLPTIFASERRLKDNVIPLFVSKKGIPWYAFTYKGDDTPQTGVMEDEVRYIPGAVKSINGINHVDYNVIAQWEAA